jgi:outer membrane protein assembly factor BamB
MIAFELNSGNEKWRWSEEGPDYGSPILFTLDGKKMIVTPTEKSIVGVDLADGKLLWKIPFVQQSRAYNAATPIANGNMIIYTGAGRGTHAVRIDKKGEDYVPTELWANPELSVQFNTPVLKQEALYGYSDKGSLFCMEATTGKTLWSDSVKHDRSGFAAILDAGPVIMALPSSSELIVFSPDKTKYSELAKIKIADLPTYATPLAAGDRIYIKDEQTITLWKMK